MNQKVKKVIDIVIDVFIVIVFVIALFVGISAINKSKTGVNSMFGMVFNTVQSDSMTGVFEVGDIVIGSKYEGEQLQEGQIITFWYQTANGKVLNTHKIDGIYLSPDGEYYYYTKGVKDGLGRDSGMRSKTDIVAVYETKISGVGKVIDFFRTPAGFIIFIVLPIVATIVYQAYVIISVLLKARDEKRVAEAAGQTTDEVKEAIIREYLSKQAANVEEPKQEETLQEENKNE